MIRTRRLPDHWQPIGGGIDPDDATPVDALIRELKEEADIDLVPADLRPVMTARYDFGDGLVHFFEATIDPATMTFNEREILDHRWLPVNAARQLTVFPATKQFLQALA